MTTSIATFAGSSARVHSAGPLNGIVCPPGSKSLTNRYLFCTALAAGRSTLNRVAVCDDSERMLQGLQALGIEAVLDRASATVEVFGCNGQIPAGEAQVDAGAAGTAMRFLTALAALGHGSFTLNGNARMRERPIGPLVEALRALGANIDYLCRAGCPPLEVRAHGLVGGLTEFDSPESSQFVSALLMAAPRAAGDVFIRVTGRGLVSRPYVRMTLQVMRAMGVEVLDADDERFVVEAPQEYRAGQFVIEPDASAATYFWAIAAMTGGTIRVQALPRESAQGDIEFVDVLRRMGCRIDEGTDFVEVTGPPRGQLKGVRVDLNAMPDTVQTLAVTALAADGPTQIENVANLRVKETDRLGALARELKKLGAGVELHNDGLTIHPPARLTPTEIDTYDDHRMAMSFALAGVLNVPVVIREAGCVSKSCPGFFAMLNTLNSSST